MPNKGTMVEDDDLEDDEEAFGLDHVGSGLSARPSIITGESSAEDKKKIEAQEAEISELKEQLAQKVFSAKTISLLPSQLEPVLFCCHVKAVESF